MPVTRIWITGSSGAGKTTLARSLAARLGLPHIELDALHHGPGWSPADPDVLRAAVHERVRCDRWIVDGNYQGVLGGLVSQRAQLRIALDPPIPVTMARVVRRTVRRAVTREELWNGNREPLSNFLRWSDPEKNIILWSWTHRHTYHQRALDAERDERLACIRLRTAGQIRRLTDHLAAVNAATR